VTAQLYASNAAGAAAGALLAGFVLFPSLGLRTTTFAGVLLNLVAATVAWTMSKSPTENAVPAVLPPHGPVQIGDVAPAARARGTAAVAVALSGAASLILQLVWTRLLSMLVGPTTYAFSAMVASFIAGIALGSTLGGRLSRRAPAPGWLAVSLLLSGIAAAVAAQVWPEIAFVVAGRSSLPGGGFASLLWQQSLLIAAAMLPMTMAFGASFSLAVGLAVGGDSPPAADVARLYAANTIGAVTGAIAGAYALVPYLGLQGSIRVAVTLTAIAALAVSLALAARRRTVLAVAAIATTALIWLSPPWDRALLSSGAYKYAAFLPDAYRGAVLRAGSLLYYREGAASTVSVRRVAGTVSLAIDGKVDASNAGDMLTQRLLAHIPLLLHPSPTHVAIIGLGSGVTLASALTHPIERADTIEISPEVIEASAEFARENAGALTNRRTRLIAGDGRTHMMLGRGTYDVVISEPSNPWMAGVAGLFTREMFEAIRERLSPEGLACQWTHAYDMSADDLRSIVATFVEVFPHALLWPVGDGDVLLVGSRQPIEPRLTLIHSGWQRPGVAADLSSIGVAGPDVVLSLVAGTESGLRSFAAGAQIQTDDRLALEFTAPQNALGRGSSDAVSTIQAMESGPVPELVGRLRRSTATRKSRGLMLLGAEAYDNAARELLAVIEHESPDSEVVDALIKAAAPAGRIEEAERQLRAVMSRDAAHAASAVGISRILASHGDFEGAEAVLRPLTGRAASIDVLEQLASVFADAGDTNRLSAAVSGLRSLAPAAESTAYFAAVLEVVTGHPHQALRIIADLRNRGGARARALTAEATAFLAMGRRDQARQSFEAALAAAPREAGSYENLAGFEAESGNDRAAASLFAEALILDPASPAARAGLQEALRRLK
jgi:spermidine synthase